MTLYGVNVSIVCMTIWTPTLQKETGPLYKRLADAIEQDIFRRRLKPGDRLPTHRELADLLQINVTTVTRGYKEARQRGLIAGTVGRGTYVASDAGTDSSLVNPEPHAPGMIEMGLVNPLYHLEPDLAAGLKNLCRRQNISQLMRYSDPQGHAEHRRIGAQWAARFKLTADENNIIVCSGAQHALTCTLSALFRSGDRIAADSLTYPGLKSLAAMLGLHLVPVDYDESGMSAQCLERICRREQIKGLYLMPAMHNPTTITIPATRRAELAKVIRSHDLIVIEDDAYALTTPKIIPPVSALVPQNSIYLAGISKAFAPGMRVVFAVTAAKFRRAVSQAVLNTTWMTSPLNAALVCMWIRDGEADKTINRKRREAAERCRLAQKILADFTFSSCPTGFFIWLTLPPPWSGNSFELYMRERGVNLFGAEKFSVGNARVPACVRLSLTGAPSIRTLQGGLHLIRDALINGRQTRFSVTM